MKVAALKAGNVEEFKQKTEEFIRHQFAPTLAIIFAGFQHDPHVIGEVISARGIQVFGASSGDSFINGELNSGNISWLFLDLDPANFRIIFEDGGNDARAAGISIARQGKAIFARPSFLVMGGNARINGDYLADGVQEEAPDRPMFGGIASDDYRMKDTFVFGDDKASRTAVIALVLNGDKVSVEGLAAGGWKPIGIERTITASKHNVVYEIDGEPAMDFMTRYSGISPEDAENYFLFLYLNFQVQLQRPGRNPVMCAPLKANKSDKSIIFAAEMPVGAKIRLCLLPGFEVSEKVVKEFNTFAKKIPAPDATIMFSCAARKMSLGPYVPEEIDGIRDAFKAPMAGFFCYGEIGTVADMKKEFYAMTCSMAVLKEIAS